MARLKDQAIKVKDTFLFDPRILKMKEGWNVREITPKYEAEIEELKNSIIKVGVQQALTIFQEGDDIFLTDGHRRLTATMRAIAEGHDIKSVPCQSEVQFASEGDRILSMLTRNSGVALNPTEQASVYKRLLAFGWDLEEIASKVGKTAAYVKGLLEYSAVAPAEIRQMVSDGEVSATTAMKTVKREGPEKAVEVLREGKKMAAACGKAKLTQKHLPKKASSKTDWAKVGPELRAKILALRSSKSLENDVDNLLEFVEGF